MSEIDIIQFIEDEQFLNDQTLSLAQRTALKAVYGLPLNGDERSMFERITGLPRYRAGIEWDEASFILGRRSGKSDQIASSIALYEACCRKHKLSVGQTGVVMVVASEKKRQAKIVFRYIEGKLRKSPVLRKMIDNITAEIITLTNGVEIQVYPCSIGRVRGMSLICFIGDECAFWKNEGRDVDSEIFDSVRPGLDFEYSKLIKISTPYMRKGEIWQDYKDFYGKANDDVLVFRGSTDLFNPGFSEKKLARLKKRKPLTYRTEHEAFFRTDLSAMYDPEMIDKAVDFDRPLEVPVSSDIEYKCFVDVSGGGGRDSYSIAIGHLEGERAVIDVVRSRAPRFDPDALTAQYCELVKHYGISLVIGDKFSGDWASNSWAKHDIEYEKSALTKSELYLEAEGPFNTERVGLPPKEMVVTQFKNLIRKTRSGGKDSVDTDSGSPEDEANVIAGVIWLLTQGKDREGAAGVPDVSIQDIWGDGISDESGLSGLIGKPCPETVKRNEEVRALYEEKQKRINERAERDLAEARERSKRTGIVTTASVILSREEDDE